jgi:threonine dehydrogenase-like Zn-dependent dehydrogenase
VDGTAEGRAHRTAAHAFWLRAPGEGEIRAETLREPGPEDVVVRTLYSGISRGTETLVFAGRVPESQWTAMRAPFQNGEFPAPVKTRYVVPASAVTPLPEDVPAGRAILGGTVETAVNALWDAAPLVGDRIAVVGAGMVGCSVAAVLARFPGVEVQLVDVDPGRAAVARALGVGFASPEIAAGECDLVVHASATEAGLARSLELSAFEGEVIELSWYGDRPVRIPLGEAFHSRRLSIRGSQVGAVSPARRARRTHADRMALALSLLADPVFDALITAECPFGDLPVLLPRLGRGEPSAVCVRVTYEAA